jgi:ABC-2 type transport system permease protein
MLYDIKPKAANFRKMRDGRYEAMLAVDAHKYYADGKGRETEAPLAEPIGFGLFAAIPGGVRSPRGTCSR